MKQLQSNSGQSTATLTGTTIETIYTESQKSLPRLIIGGRRGEGDHYVALLPATFFWQLIVCFGAFAFCNCLSAQTISVEIAVAPSSSPGKNTVSVGYRAFDGNFVADDGTDEWNAQTITLGWVAGSGMNVSAPATNANITNFATPSSFSFVDNFYGSSNITSYTLNQLGGTDDGFIYTTFVVNGSTSNQPIAEGELLPVFIFDVPNSWPIGNNSIFLLTGQPAGIPIGLSPVILNSVLGQVWDNQASGSILPLELLALSAELQGQDGLLKWTTAWETDTDFFEIEHSTDGRSFKVLGQITAAGTSQYELDYRFLHRQLSIGQHLYRLRMVDLDGSWTHSPIVQLSVNSKGPRLAAYPNPTSGMLQLSGAPDDVEIYLYDSSGRQVGSFQNVQQLDLQPYADGIYWLSALNSSGQILLSQRVVKHE